MKSAGNSKTEDRFEVILEKAQNLSMDGEEQFWDVNRRHGVPQQHYSVEMKVSGGGQVTKIILQLDGSRSSGAELRKSNKWTKIRVVPRVLQAFDEEHDIKKFQPMHEKQKMERMEPGFVAQEIIAKDKFRSSTLDLFQACDVLYK